MIVVDEIGKMELLSRKFEGKMREILNNNQVTLLTTIPVPGPRPLTLVEQVRSHPQCLLMQVDVIVYPFQFHN